MMETMRSLNENERSLCFCYGFGKQRDMNRCESTKQRNEEMSRCRSRQESRKAKGERTSSEEYAAKIKSTLLPSW